MFYKQPLVEHQRRHYQRQETQQHAAEEGSRHKPFYLLLTANG
jgi:hypothetical protein